MEIFNYKKFRSLHLVNLAEFFSHLASGILVPIYFLFTERIGGDAFDSGTSYGIYLLVHALAITIFSRCDFVIHNRRKIIVITYFFQIVTSFAHIFISNVNMLIVLQVFLAIQTSLYATVFHSYYGELAHNSTIDESKVWSLWNISTYLGVGLAAVIGGIVANSYNFNYIFYLMIIFSTFSFLISLMFEKDF